MWLAKSQRIVSEPTRSAASSKTIILPLDLCITLSAADFDRIDPWSVWRMTFELFPAGNGQFLQLILTADDLEAATLWAVVDGQSQSPVAFLRDHPVVHIAQPVQFTLKTE